MRYLEVLNEAKSGISSQIDQLLRSDRIPEENLLLELLTGEKPSWKQVGGNRVYPQMEKIPLSNELKRKYPDLVFYIQALSGHISAHRYFTEWEKVKNFLTYQESNKTRTFYRYWTPGRRGDWEEVAGQLIRGETNFITENISSPFLSYTRIKPGEAPLRTFFRSGYEGGYTPQSPIIVTQHHFAPIFDPGRFTVHVYNQLKRKLPNVVNLVQSHEMEVIGPTPKHIDLNQIMYIWSPMGIRFTLDQLKNGVIEIFGTIFNKTKLVDSLKKSLSEYGRIDKMYFEKIAITDDPEKSGILKSLRHRNLQKNPELTELVGKPIYIAIV